MGYLTIREYSENDSFYTKGSSLKENFGIYSALHCPMRRPTVQDNCFCTDLDKNSIWPQCHKYKGKKVNNICTESVCCNSCDINQQNKCPF